MQRHTGKPHTGTHLRNSNRSPDNRPGSRSLMPCVPFCTVVLRARNRSRYTPVRFRGLELKQGTFCFLWHHYSRISVCRNTREFVLLQARANSFRSKPLMLSQKNSQSATRIELHALLQKIPCMRFWTNTI